MSMTWWPFSVFRHKKKIITSINIVQYASNFMLLIYLFIFELKRTPHTIYIFHANWRSCCTSGHCRITLTSLNRSKFLNNIQKHTNVHSHTFAKKEHKKKYILIYTQLTYTYSYIHILM